jgi:CheY-like chemotaxis protein/two-component sensor histidine kinase
MMTRLIDDLLDVSRITSDRLEIRRQPIGLADVLHEALETSRPLLDAKGHEVSLVLPPEPVVLEADPVRLAQVFSNLLNNAAKYTESGGHVRLIAERRASEVVVGVEDDGIGISADQLATIFDMFAQVERSSERTQGGLGIGLSLAKRLVEMHGGTIAAHSPGRGKGSHFMVRLPLSQASHEERPPPAAPGAEASSSHRILVADDSEDNADSLALMLRRLGNEVRTAYGGLQAVEEAKSFRPDVVLLDIGMPGLDGYQAARRIRDHEWGKGVVLIALTGWGQGDDERRANEAGFDHHLTKPLDPTRLREILAGLGA